MSVHIVGCCVYPRDSASAVLAVSPTLCLSVCLSVTSQSSVENDERIAHLWYGAFLRLVVHCVLRKFVTSRNKGTFLWNSVPNLDWEKISPQPVDSCQRPSPVHYTERLHLYYRTVMGVTQRVARVHLHQLRLVNSQHWWPVATAADTGGRQWCLTLSVVSAGHQ